MPNEIIDQELGKLQAWIAAGLCFIVLFAVTMTGLMLYQAYKLGENSAELRAAAVETHDALCALKTDIRVRRNAAVQFLQDNPDGIPGIPPAVLQESIDNQTSTLRALSPLDCPVP